MAKWASDCEECEECEECDFRRWKMEEMIKSCILSLPDGSLLQLHLPGDTRTGTTGLRAGVQVPRTGTISPVSG